MRPVRHFSRGWLGGVLVLFFALISSSAFSQTALGEGSDLEIGGPGNGRGKFAAIADLTFDLANNLYVLDTSNGTLTNTLNNFLVQKFDNNGVFLSQFPVEAPQPGAINAPAHLLVDRAGNVYVSQPRAGKVQQYNAAGVRVRDLLLPDASALALRVVAGQEQILVMPSPRNATVSQISVFSANGTKGTSISLSRPLRNCLSFSTDRNGNLFFLAEVNQIYKFDPNGTLLTVLGSGVDDYYLSDGSVLLHTLALDSAGNLYTTTPHNPGFVTCFRADLTTYTQRAAQFNWYDAWGCYGGRTPTPYAIDRNDRLWVGVNGTLEPGNRLHYRPCVLRTRAGFFTQPQTGVVERPTLGLGVIPTITTPRSDNFFTTLKAIPVDFTLKAANRRITQATLTCTIYDLNKTPVMQSSATVSLTNGVLTRRTLVFKPAKWGAYEAQFEISSGGIPIAGVGKHLGFSPAYANLPLLNDGESKGGSVDSGRNAMLGLSLLRTNTSQDFAALDAQITEATSRKTTLIVQFVGADDCTSDKVQVALTRFRGRVKYWEVVNEPNLSLSPEAYVTLLKRVAGQIRQLDPGAKILAPALCGIDLTWYARFYALGGHIACDILTLHDYEGNESVDPAHWAWKWGQLRAIMAQYGDSAKPIWQTERAILGVRAGMFTGGLQAVRMTLHRDVLDALGTPSDANLHYYTNEMGFAQCPSFVWSAAGPHPAALLLRTRAAMTRGRTFARTLDFGVTGNKLVLGLRYTGTDGSTVTLRNYGTNDLSLDFLVTGGSALEVVDCFGNSQTVSVTNGHALLTISVLPHYVRLKPGQDIAPVPVNFGVNLAPLARFSCSASNNGNFASLTNGVLESIHAGNPNATFWTGDLEVTGALPTLEMQFSTVRTFRKMLVFGLRADNAYCALLDFDVQAFLGGAWTTVQSARQSCPPSDLSATPGCLVTTWYLDQNLAVLSLPDVRTDRLRIVPRRITSGLLPDTTAAMACFQSWGITILPRLMLREIEVYE